MTSGTRSEFNQDALAQLRIRYIQVLAVVAIIAAPIGFVFELVIQLTRDGAVKLPGLVFTASFAVLGAGVLILVGNSKRIWLASVLLIGTLVAASVTLKMPSYMVV